jgi:hypothetical protein
MTTAQAAAHSPYATEDSHPTARSMSTQLRDIRKTLPLRVLSDADWRQWTTSGYVVVRNAVPHDKVQRLVDVLWQFDEKDPDDPSTWYAPQRREHKMRELNNTGMLEIYHHQALWDTRQEPKVYDTFVDLWDREDLWVAIDRANLNPPKKVPGNPNGFIHWDANTAHRPLPIGVQGVLSLRKQGGDIGGFQCVPGLFEHFDEWLKTQPEDRDPLHPDVSGFEVVNIDMEPGDLLVWNTLLAHGVRPNHSKDQVRMAQYISMFPADFDDEAERARRIESWRERKPPVRDAFPGDPREWERKRATTAELSPLGEKLLGLERW